MSVSVPAEHIRSLAAELQLRPAQVEAAARLLGEDATVPFIARYRKEATGALDEVAVTAVRDGLAALAELDKRRAAMRASLEERGLLTPDLDAALTAAPNLARLEDVYLPFRPKRRTRAAQARERGLEPLALWLLDFGPGDPAVEAARYVDADNNVPDAEAALAGARDILAERFAEDAEARARVRALLAREGVLTAEVTPGKEEEGATYRDYFHWEQTAAKAPSHRVLAVFRAEAEGVLRVALRPRDAAAVSNALYGLFLPLNARARRSPAVEQARAALDDGCRRLLLPSLENELRGELKKRADAEAIRVFGENLRQLLLAPPLGTRRILAVDPGFRTGCKVVCLDRQGGLLDHAVVQPHAGSAAARAEAGRVVLALLQKYDIEAVAVGNGTAGRETEAFLRELPGRPASVPVIMVSESGASVYSASEAARAEFPDLDLTYRGAVSIGRRLADPLAELVKIDPKAIGVGQYQHDVNQAELKRRLDDVVTSCVNAVGVELNTASEQLLTYVSGLGPVLARNIVAWRAEHGPFASRRALLDVPRLGPKAFEQAAGFVRVRGGAHPLDASAVHPESYPLVERMARDLNASVADLLADPGLRARIDVRRYAAEGAGLPTLTDILAELDKPGRDPREPFHAFAFAEGVHDLDDLRPGMRLPGIVTNITAFGAFVDIGVHQDGLVHISQMADRYVRDPAEVVRLQQEVAVTVLDVDLKRRRISLSMFQSTAAPSAD